MLLSVIFVIVKKSFRTFLGKLTAFDRQGK